MKLENNYNNARTYGNSVLWFINSSGYYLLSSSVTRLYSYNTHLVPVNQPHRALMTASAYSCVLAFPPKSPVIVCISGQLKSSCFRNVQTNLSLCEHLENGALNLVRVLSQTHVLQHHNTTE